jgi:hypothetical protein
VSSLGNFCTLEPSPLPSFDYLVRFRSKATNAIIVTVRVKDVEQIFCTSQNSASIAVADLTASSPAFVDVVPPQVAILNRIVGAMIR